VANFAGTKSAFALLIPETMGSRGKKRSPSAHQKQIWFFTGLCMLIIIVFTVLAFWLANSPTLFSAGL
jgi:hypothetical protein